MLKKMRRGGLPGVKDATAIKTCGQKEWVDVGDIGRLFDTRPASQFQNIGLHALLTLLDGGSRQKAERLQADATSMAVLSSWTPAVAVALTQRRQDDCIRTISDIKKAIREQKRLRRVRRVDDVPEVDVPEVADVGEVEAVVDDSQPDAEERAVATSSAADVRQPVQPVASMASYASSASEADQFEDDTSRSSQDSRSEVEEEDSDDSAGTTIEFGLSLDGVLDSLADVSEEPHSPACSSGSE
jgi:hypothetical protein